MPPRAWSSCGMCRRCNPRTAAHWRNERSQANLARMAPDAGAREAMLVGRAIIRAIVRDPLLPEAIMDPAPRRALIDATRAYQLQARGLWVELLLG